MIRVVCVDDVLGLAVLDHPRRAGKFFMWVILQTYGVSPQCDLAAGSRGDTDAVVTKCKF